MGKCMRKDKVTVGDVALMELSHSESILGVRTRAKTLALQRLQPAVAPSSPPQPDYCYLELRTRRLVKPLPPTLPQNSRRARQSCGCRGKENPNLATRNDVELAKIASISAENMEIEACFAENTICEPWERGTRESTPCSLIRAMDTAVSPPAGSTTKRTCSSAAPRQRTQSVVNIPTPPELEELFAHDERSQQHHFIEKYNFDIVTDSPLPGRYEWVTVRP